MTVRKSILKQGRARLGCEMITDDDHESVTKMETSAKQNVLAYSSVSSEIRSRLAASSFPLLSAR